MKSTVNIYAGKLVLVLIFLYMYLRLPVPVHVTQSSRMMNAASMPYSYSFVSETRAREVITTISCDIWIRSWRVKGRAGNVMR